MKEFLFIALFIGVYFLLQLYVLPKMGISTRLRKSCQVTEKKIEPMDKTTDTGE